MRGRFEAETVRYEYEGERTEYYDLVPVSPGVSLRTASGARVRKENGEERTWKALWDSGAIFTTIPYALFVTTLNVPASGRTIPLIGVFGGEGRKEDCYLARIGIPGLPELTVRAIAPRELPGTKLREHITLGRDVISRLVVKSASGA